MLDELGVRPGQDSIHQTEGVVMQPAAILKTVILGSALAAASGAAASAECIRMTNVHGFTVIDDTHVVLNGGTRHHYLVTTRSRCPDLRWGMQIGTTLPRTGTVCSPVGEYLVSEDGWRCPIETIEEVEDLETARTLVEARNAAEGEVVVEEEDRYVPGGTDDIYDETNEG